MNMAGTPAEEIEKEQEEEAAGTAGSAICEWGRLVGDERITDMGLLVEAHAHLTRVLAAELEAECGLPLTWFDVLLRLGRAPDRRMTMSELATQIALTSGGVTRLVDRIADAGYVERQNCPSDRRSIYVALTPEGADLLHQAAAAHVRSLDRHLVDRLDKDERLALRGILGKLRGEGPVCGGTI